MIKKLEYVERTKEKVQNMNNEDLLFETMSLSQGDDYDGCFTKLGRIEYDLYLEELEKRLKEIGFY